jgi:hypothetical protein
VSVRARMETDFKRRATDELVLQAGTTARSRFASIRQVVRERPLFAQTRHNAHGPEST